MAPLVIVLMVREMSLWRRYCVKVGSALAAGVFLGPSIGWAQDGPLFSPAASDPVIYQPSAMTIGPIAKRRIAFRARDGRFLMASFGGSLWSSLEDAPLSRYLVSHCEEDVWQRAPIYPYPLDLSGCHVIPRPERRLIQGSIIRLRLSPFVLDLGPLPRAALPPIQIPAFNGPFRISPTFAEPNIVVPPAFAPPSPVPLLKVSGAIVPNIQLPRGTLPNVRPLRPFRRLVAINPQINTQALPKYSLSTTGRAGTVLITGGTAYTFGPGAIALVAIPPVSSVGSGPLGPHTPPVGTTIRPNVPLSPTQTALVAPLTAPMHGAAPGPLTFNPVVGAPPVQITMAKVPTAIVPSAQVPKVTLPTVASLPPLVGPTVGGWQLNPQALPKYSLATTGRAGTVLITGGTAYTFGPGAIAPVIVSRMDTGDTWRPLRPNPPRIATTFSSNTAVGVPPISGVSPLTLPSSVAASLFALGPIVGQFATLAPIASAPILISPLIGYSRSTTGRAGTVLITGGTAYSFGIGIVAPIIAANGLGRAGTSPIHVPVFPSIFGPSADVGSVQTAVLSPTIAPVALTSSVIVPTAIVATSKRQLGNVGTAGLTQTAIVVPIIVGTTVVPRSGHMSGGSGIVVATSVNGGDVVPSPSQQILSATISHLGSNSYISPAITFAMRR